MGSWCDPHKSDCSKRNFWGNHNLTDPDSEPTSYYPAWYKAVADAVISVDPLLTVGGPASSDCWGNELNGSTCYGGHMRPTAEDLLSTVGQNWALGLVEYGAKHDVRVDFSSSHSYSSPCGNATSLHEEFKMFADVIHRSSRPNTTVIVTEWSADPIPNGVGCADVYSPHGPVIANYHDTAAQATFATKAAWLIDGGVPLLSHWAFSDIFEEQGFTWDVFNGGFGARPRRSLLIS
jgi:beta-xylosidase